MGTSVTTPARSKCPENSLISSLSTPWWPSTSPRKNGINSRTLRPRPADSPWPRLAPAPLSLTTSTVVSMLVAGTPTRTLPFVFDPLIQEYHGISADAKHTSDMDPSKVNGNINPEVPVHSTRIRVGRNIDGFGLSPGITKQQRIDIEKLMSGALSKLTGDLAGKYYPLTGMDEKVRQQLVDDHFLFVSGDPNLTVAGMERDWPEGHGIFHNDAKTFLLWVNEEDQMRIISMEKGGDVKGVFERLARGIKAVGDSVKAESGKDFALDERYGFIHSCPTNLGTGMRASVHVDLPGWTKEGVDKLKARCEALAVQPRGTRGESGGQTGCTYDISNKHRLGYSEVQLVQVMIDAVNTLYKEDLDLQKKHGMI